MSVASHPPSVVHPSPLAPESRDVLDDCVAAFDGGDPRTAMTRLIDHLGGLRRTCPEGWRPTVEAVRRHPVLERTHQDPLTRRAFEKPRGYPGDAVIIDAIYFGDRWLPPAAEESTRRQFQVSLQAAAIRSVRERRRVAARAIDRVALRRPGARILSVACGHLREIELACTPRGGQMREIIGLDQDGRSLAEALRCYPDVPLRPVRSSVAEILLGRRRFSGLDLVYSTGLFDYLAPRLARRLLRRLFSFLRPGGELLVANFHPATPEIGYMEACMDWWLLHRTREEMLGLASALPAGVAELRVSEDRLGCIVYLRASRA